MPAYFLENSFGRSDRLSGLVPAAFKRREGGRGEDKKRGIIVRLGALAPRDTVVSLVPSVSEAYSKCKNTFFEDGRGEGVK